MSELSLPSGLPPADVTQEDRDPPLVARPCVLAVEGRASQDGRFVEIGALTWDERIPLTDPDGEIVGLVEGIGRDIIEGTIKSAGGQVAIHDPQAAYALIRGLAYLSPYTNADVIAGLVACGVGVSLGPPMENHRSPDGEQEIFTAGNIWAARLTDPADLLWGQCVLGEPLPPLARALGVTGR